MNYKQVLVGKKKFSSQCSYKREKDLKHKFSIGGAMKARKFYSVAVLQPVGILSLLCLIMYLFRVFYTGSLNHIYLFWNLFLACVPLLMAVPFYRNYKHKGIRHGKTLLFFSLWLLFFPNSPYIITDLIHLAETNHDIPLWYDSLLIFSFALAGIYAGFLSLIYIHAALKDYFREYGGWLLISVIFLVSGYGIYLGRELRWNSWDVFTRPHLLAGDVYSNLNDPSAWGMTLFFSIFLLSGWYVFKNLTGISIKNLLQDESDQMSE